MPPGLKCIELSVRDVTHADDLNKSLNTNDLDSECHMNNHQQEFLSTGGPSSAYHVHHKNI